MCLNIICLKSFTARIPLVLRASLCTLLASLSTCFAAVMMSGMFSTLFGTGSAYFAAQGAKVIGILRISRA